MNRNEILDVVAVIINNMKNLPIEISEKTSLKDDLGLDSLDTIELCMRLEQKYSICIEDSETKKWKNVSDVIDTIQTLF